MKMQNLLATFSAAAIAVSVTFPTMNQVDKTTNPLADPVAIMAVKTDNPMTLFIGFVHGHGGKLENLPDANGYNSVIELQRAFKQFMTANKVSIVIGEHGYSIKRLLDSMLGNQVIDMKLRQEIEVIDLVGAIQASYPDLNTLVAYAEEHGLHLPSAKSMIGRTNCVSLVYTDLYLNRLIQRGVAPTTANMMPYKKPELMAA